ncbi:MAG: TonB-dependent receptor plug domain-containing protein [Odoribacter splanchnicus]
MDEVVVTGIFTRKKESFTGSSTTFKAEELKAVGASNLVQSLRTLDPSFKIVENNQFGSDPNRMPDIEIRGKSSVMGLKEEYGTDPNQPLFILDGFETTLETIMDLNMNRVASVTLLKDAASTAIYGSKAANGVVVIETKAPEGTPAILL